MSVIDLIGSDMVLDIAKLKDVDVVSFVRFLTENGNELGQRINETAKVHLLKGEVSGHEPAFATDPEFQAKWFNRWYQALRGRLCQKSSKGSAIPIIFSVAVYLYDCYGLSCSKLILGCETQTRVPLWLQNWLAQVEHLSSAEMTQLYTILENGPTIRCDTLYVLKSRVQEMAAERGVRVDDFCMYPGFATLDYPTIRDFSEVTLKETGNAYTLMKPYLGNHKMLRFLIAMCVNYQVTPDYLLLQDYSEFAVTAKGRYYAPSARHLMSMLLNANAETRNRAIGFVCAVTANRVAAGGNVPCTVESLEESASVLNVMETMSAAAGTTTKKEMEAQIVETLKPKLVEILSNSTAPVSGTQLYKVVDGHSRLVRRALFLLEKDGIVESTPRSRGTALWKMAKPSKK